MTTEQWLSPVALGSSLRTIASGRASDLEALVRSAPFSRAVRVLSYALLAALLGVLLLIATATVPVLFGYHTYVVRGGSMEPQLEVGSVAVTHPTSPRALAVGDIIAYRSLADGSTVLHRIVEVQSEDGEPLFVTQGDQNRTRDAEPVALEGQGDKVIYSVPYAGYALIFASSGVGMALLIGLPLIVLAALFLRNAPISRRREAQTSVAAERQGPPPLQAVDMQDLRPQAAAASPRPQTGPAPTIVPFPGPRAATRPTIVAFPSPRLAGQDIPVFLIRQLPHPERFAPLLSMAAARTSAEPHGARRRSEPDAAEWPRRRVA